MIKYFKQFLDISALLSEKEDGSMKLINGVVGKMNLNNRKRFFESAGLNETDVFSAEFIHGANVAVVTKNSEKIFSGTDALVTDEKDVALVITVADCVPVYFYEKENKIIGLAHAGWRGTVGGIVKNTIDKIVELGGNSKDIHVTMGPGINSCHFEIKEDVLKEFARYEKYIEKRQEKMFVDLKGIILEQLHEKGIENQQIENDNVCTFEDERFFSYRRDKPEIVETMLAIIAMR